MNFLQCHVGGQSHRAQCLQRRWSGRVIWIVDDHDSFKSGGELKQRLEILEHHLRARDANAGNVSTRAAYAVYQVSPLDDSVGKHYGDIGSLKGSLHGASRLTRKDKHQVYLIGHEFVGDALRLIRVSVRALHVVSYVLSLDIAQFGHPDLKDIDHITHSICTNKNAHLIHPGRLAGAPTQKQNSYNYPDEDGPPISGSILRMIAAGHSILFSSSFIP